jgi:hypothetical protein
VAVFVASSDNTVDVLRRVHPAIAKFWPDCPYNIYVGLNSQPSPSDRATAVYAAPSQWREELATQLRQLQEDWVILVLDDFLIRSEVNHLHLAQLVDVCIRNGWPYLRMIPIDRSLLSRLLRPKSHDLPAGVEMIPAGYPYYSSLQIALWKKSHLLRLLGAPGNIWDFEHLEFPDAAHYAVTGPACIRYRHLVEKGRWLPDSAALLARAGLPAELGTRASWPGSVLWKQRIARWRFQIVGYSIMKMRRRLRGLHSRTTPARQDR